MAFSSRETVKTEIHLAIQNCSMRGLTECSKWLSELSYSLKVVVEPPKPNFAIHGSEYNLYMMAKSLFDLSEFDRCAFFTQICKTPCARFLHYYSSFLAIDKKKKNNLRQSTFNPDPIVTEKLNALFKEMKCQYEAKQLDGYMLYLYFLLMMVLNLQQYALKPLLLSLHKEPLLWPAWLDLADLIRDRTMLKKLILPEHWMKKFFLAYAYSEMQLHDEALRIYCQMQDLGFEKCNYIVAQTALAYHNKRDVVNAISSFNTLRKIDPYRLDNLDTLSNLLFVREERVELAVLAHQAIKVDKFRVETCCIVGNYYSLRGEHQKAVISFQRALKLKPTYLAAWTLMGHEYMEMKNTHAAIRSYRQAIDLDRSDYRAWYGLGQTYEIIKMPNYCLYYYKQAHALRPNDSRMLVALGETYEKLGHVQEALKCFYKARGVGDIEGLALLRLARLYEQSDDEEKAREAYTDYTRENAFVPANNKIDICFAYRFLARYHLKYNNLDVANDYAQRCLSYEETKEEGKSLLRSIVYQRACMEAFTEDETEGDEESSGAERSDDDSRSLTPVMEPTTDVDENAYQTETDQDS